MQVDRSLLYAYRDASGWGTKVAQAGERAGLPVHLFDDADAVPDRPVPVFVHMNHRPGLRERDKRLMRRLARKQVLLIPTGLEGELYDDKVRQYALLHRYMPPSLHLVTRRQSKTAVTAMQYPFVSKAATGASSRNVRLVRTPAEAECEISLAFGPGIPLHWDQRQRGYLFWQRFCPGNAHDWRVIIIARRYACILKRFNREEVPFASGSGRDEPAYPIPGGLTERLLDRALEIVEAHAFSLCAMDFVLDGEEIKLLETSVGWPYHRVRGARFFTHGQGAWQPTRYLVTDLFDLIVDAVRRGESA
ncbi:MAG: hypothetical protein RDU89_05520 [bacterium]|nr:hypothetical protein [bacterium]